ncbi:centromere protein H isoform X1 [Passer montanus]|uniref:centromere protein H isoform X1 n=1 Tax=Passer montanus TaxID=9160 RepID=UPI001961AE64|nr:centromere protein H isoform X1 [Passer montanus]
MAGVTRDAAPASAPAWSQDSDGGFGEVDIRTLLRLKDRMKEQLIEYNTAVLASQENFLDQGIEENFIQSATRDLERDLEEAKVSFQNKTLALQRIQIMDALRNKLKQEDEDSRYATVSFLSLIMETMKHIVLLSRTIIDYQQQVCQKEQQLIDIKRKRLSLKKNGGQKLQQIHTMMKKPKEEQARVNVTEKEKMLAKLEKERQMTTIIQNVFQNIIIGSRVNWAEDPSLKAIVLRLEKNV